MTWIAIYQTLPTHRKTLAVAERLDIPPVHVVGHLVTLWLWALDNAPTGELRVSPKTIARAAQWEGHAEEFVEALIEAGFLDRKDDAVWLHDWKEFTGKLIERRMAERDRKKRAKEYSEGIPAEFHGNSTENPRNIHGNSAEIPRKFRGTSTEIPRNSCATAQVQVQAQVKDNYLNYTLAHASNVACAEEQPEETEAVETAVEQTLFEETEETDTGTPTLNETSKRTSPRPPFISKRQEELFDAFWKEYPRKKSKGQAERAWVKLRVDETLFKAIMDGLSRAKESYEWQKEGGQYIPYPATWLNAKGWEDEYRPAVASSARPRADPSVSRMRAYFEALEEFAREGGEET